MMNIITTRLKRRVWEHYGRHTCSYPPARVILNIRTAHYTSLVVGELRRIRLGYLNATTTNRERWLRQFRYALRDIREARAKWASGGGYLP